MRSANLPVLRTGLISLARRAMGQRIMESNHSKEKTMGKKHAEDKATEAKDAVEKKAEAGHPDESAGPARKKHAGKVAAGNQIDPAALAPTGELSDKQYAREMKKLHVELVKLQQWVVHKGLKVCIVFEGRDGAGKGGTIKAITERVSPRIFRVVALPAPTERQKTQMYLQRYVPHLPAAG